MHGSLVMHACSLYKSMPDDRSCIAKTPHEFDKAHTASSSL